jgi:DNA repair exonuclease SbcCD ATPase subunit
VIAVPAPVKEPPKLIVKDSPKEVPREAPKDSPKEAKVVIAPEPAKKSFPEKEQPADEESFFLRLKVSELQNQLEKRTAEWEKRFSEKTNEYETKLKEKEKELSQALGRLRDLMEKQEKNQEELKKSRYMMGEDLQKLNVEQLEELLANLKKVSSKVKIAITKVPSSFSFFFSLPSH